jgi:hypothetical protein
VPWRSDRQVTLISRCSTVVRRCGAVFQRRRDADQLIPLLRDQRRVHGASEQGLESPVVGVFVELVQLLVGKSLSRGINAMPSMWHSPKTSVKPSVSVVWMWTQENVVLEPSSTKPASRGAHETTWVANTLIWSETLAGFLP